MMTNGNVIILERDVTSHVTACVERVRKQTEHMFDTLQAILTNGPGSQIQNMAGGMLAHEAQNQSRGALGGVQHGLRVQSIPASSGLRALSTSSIWRDEQGEREAEALGQRRFSDRSDGAGRLETHRREAHMAQFFGQDRLGNDEGVAGARGGVAITPQQHYDFDSALQRTTSVFANEDVTVTARQGIRKMSLEDTNSQREAAIRALEEHKRANKDKAVNGRVNTRRPSAVNTSRRVSKGLDVTGNDIHFLPPSNSHSALLDLGEEQDDHLHNSRGPSTKRTARSRAHSPLLPFSPLQRNKPKVDV